MRLRNHNLLITTYNANLNTSFFKRLYTYKIYLFCRRHDRLLRHDRTVCVAKEFAKAVGIGNENKTLNGFVERMCNRCVTHDYRQFDSPCKLFLLLLKNSFVFNCLILIIL